MEREGSTRLNWFRLVSEQQLDGFVRFVRSRWLTYYLFMSAFTIMVMTLLLMVFLLVSYLFNSPVERTDETLTVYEVQEERNVIKELIETQIADLDPLYILFYFLGLIILVMVLCYGRFRWCSGSGLNPSHFDYEEI